MNSHIPQRNDHIAPFLMRLCIWTGLVLVAMTVTGFGGFLGYVVRRRHR